MNIHRRLCFAGLVSIGLAACDNYDDGMTGGPDPEPPAPVDLTTWVKNQFATTADDTDPVDVDETEFEFSDDPAAYDDLLQ